MHYIISIFILLVLITCPAKGLTSFEYQFNTNSNELKWESPDPNTKVVYRNGNMNITSNSQFPYVVSPPLFCFADNFDMLIIKMKASNTGVGSIFWATDFDPQFNSNKLVNFDLGRSNQFKTYYINLRHAHPAWSSKVLRLALSPFQGSGQAEIDYIKLTRTNLFTNFLSGWQEYWGPKGRIVIGSTINVIASSKIWGKPLNYYFYWVLSFSFISLLIRNLILSKKFQLAWDKTSISLLIIFLALWGLSECNNLYNEWHQLKIDFKNYAGKTLDQKYAQALGFPDLYEFIKFCESKTPPESICALYTSLPTDPKPSYYLYPRTGIGTPEYILVFKYNLPIEAIKNMKLIHETKTGGKIYQKQ
ncbi:MAG: hypothetical protein KKB81_01105 [Candidatus Margulisbacteria bacterium]|nr:hypothetical protein [Candidatus Margulisiibacteriota bacterium]MBU1021108.1 hypothetical protein [Candidatus Margulisiibacteriota bacterium]MBU1728663.1 hypothetical protein [Candidatus Margulisiibacteriota bacterium]MBU1955114.1 hypothetical protein [Candidatus Margulisiibacteriota bacterium]